MAGGGVIIIRNAMKTALTNPVVHGMLPKHIRDQIDTFVNSDVSMWTTEEHDIAAHAFTWVSHHC